MIAMESDGDCMSLVKTDKPEIIYQPVGILSMDKHSNAMSRLSTEDNK